eukprot:g384.t1
MSSRLTFYLFLLYFFAAECTRDFSKLKKDIQDFLDETSNISGYAFSVGIVGRDFSFGFGSGSRKPFQFENGPLGNVDSKDTFLLGSGTKPYTAAAVMRLVDRGIIRLDDKASLYLDKSLKFLFKNDSATFVNIFGPEAKNVTVGHLIRMESGIADFDIPSFDNEVLNSKGEWSIAKTLLNVANFGAPSGCSTFNCTWVCPQGPGTCVSYSSTSFILAGLVVLACTDTSLDWTTFDLKRNGLGGLGRSDQSIFPSKGTMEEDLTVAGSSLAYGAAELWKQDASILGWTCGNGISSGLDAAWFEYNLLSPYFLQEGEEENRIKLRNHQSPQQKERARINILSLASIKKMLTFKTLDTGWAKGYIEYGGGIMIQNVNSKDPQYPAPRDGELTYYGHGGDTYGFMSDSGFFPKLNISMSVIVNQDSDYNYPSLVTCQIAKMYMEFKGLDTSNVECLKPYPPLAATISIKPSATTEPPTTVLGMKFGEKYGDDERKAVNQAVNAVKKTVSNPIEIFRD